MIDSPLKRIRPEIRSVDGYHLTHHDCPVKLNQNESPFDIPDDLKNEILADVRKRPWFRYPQPMEMDLVEALADFAGWRPDALIVCNGSNTLVQLVLAVSTRPGAPVVIPSPGFSLYGLYAGFFGGRVVPVDLRADYTFDVPGIREAACRESANMIILGSPNNPTGCVVSNADLEALLGETDALVMVDEAYAEFSDETARDLIGEYPNLIVLKTFSKALGAAGIRIGYLMAHPEIAREVLKAKVPFDINVFSHSAALHILKHDGLIRERVGMIREERERVFAALGKVEGVRPHPSHANFILFEVGNPGRVFDGLIERGILIRNVTSYPLLDNALRVSIGKAEENTLFLDALEETLKESCV
ncbi:MAG: histidinol-phosphate transaminase [Gemmatimonadota bacterium]|nr:histidinol-phosphate transaminase [Gemmatimonadota bacterium]